MSIQYRSEVPTVSEYEPITQELFEMADVNGDYGVETVSISYEKFSVECSKIDSIHAKLEDENQSLKNIIAKLKHNTTVMELFCKNLENAAKERKDVTLWDVDYIPVPVDADGVPICVGDELWSDNGVWFKVKELHFDNGKWAVYAKDKAGIGFYVAFEIMHHHNHDTLERIIEDATHCDQMLAEYDLDAAADFFDALVERCKALAGDAE